MYFISPDPQDVTRALESWRWIGISEKRPFLITAFADVFFESSDGVWFLDTLEGKLKRVCQTKEELEQILATDEGKNLYLLTGFVDRAHREGMTLIEGECYDFKINPIIGGKIDYSNVGKMNFVVALNLRGQIHDQTRHMKPGTRISKFVLVEEKKTKSLLEMPRDFQELCELADREIRLGAVDEALMARAHKEATGVTARAHQIYWRLRALAIQEEAIRTSGESYVHDLKARLDAEEKRKKLRREIAGWMWALLCFVSLVGTYVFPRIAFTALRRSTLAFYACAVMGVVCLCLAVVAYTASKRHARGE